MSISNKDCWLKDSCNHIDCDKFCLRLFKLDYLFDAALIPLNLRGTKTLVADADGTDVKEFKQLKHITDNIIEFINAGSNLYLHSPGCGNGKTSWALRCVQSYFNNIWYSSELTCKALFISVPKLLIALKNNISSTDEYAEYIKENIAVADLVIWDDIATKQTTVFEAENLLSMLETRLIYGKANIFTSNLTDDELHKALGDRLASRISNLGYNIELHGKDKRGF